MHTKSNTSAMGDDCIFLHTTRAPIHLDSIRNLYGMHMNAQNQTRTRVTEWVGGCACAWVLSSWMQFEWFPKQKLIFRISTVVRFKCHVLRFRLLARSPQFAREKRKKTVIRVRSFNISPNAPEARPAGWRNM